MRFRKKATKEKEGKVFVDLNGYRMPRYSGSDARIKILEIRTSSDLKPIQDLAYRGNILILDFAEFEEETEDKRALARELLKTARDIDGSFSEASNTLMILAPSGLEIERLRISHVRK